ncbi:MAG: hypothetical protein ACRDSS_13960, partial [Actinocrinis sp.]
VWHSAWTAYTRTILPLAGQATGGREWAEVGRFLGPSITEHYQRHPVEQTVAHWRAAGIEDVGTRAMSLGGGLVMWGRRAGTADRSDASPPAAVTERPAPEPAPSPEP